MHRAAVHPSPAPGRHLDHPASALASLNDAQAVFGHDGAEGIRCVSQRGGIAQGIGDPGRGPIGAAGQLLHLVLGVAGLGTVEIIERQGHQRGLNSQFFLGPQRLHDRAIEPSRDVPVPPPGFKDAAALLVPGVIPLRAKDAPRDGIPFGNEDMEVVFRGVPARPLLPVTDHHAAIRIEPELLCQNGHCLLSLLWGDVLLGGEFEVAD